MGVMGTVVLKPWFAMLMTFQVRTPQTTGKTEMTLKHDPKLLALPVAQKGEIHTVKEWVEEYDTMLNHPRIASRPYGTDYKMNTCFLIFLFLLGLWNIKPSFYSRNWVLSVSSCLITKSHSIPSCVVHMYSRLPQTGTSTT